MTVEQIAQGLDGKRCPDGWMACCPAHDDRTPSLHIAEANHRVLVRCHAGCSQDAVIAALRDRGLWGSTGSDDWRELRDGIRYPAAWGGAIAEYRYTDESGGYLYSVLRFLPKSFRPGYFRGDKWVWKKHPHQVLYRLREVVENPIVFLVEGEKDVETLREWGFTATTAPGGAKAPWLPQFTVALADKEVIVVPDNDGPGWQRAEAVCEKLVGKVARLRVFDLPEGIKDITEWFTQGRSECELIARLEGVNAV